MACRRGKQLPKRVVLDLYYPAKQNSVYDFSNSKQIDL